MTDQLPRTRPRRAVDPRLLVGLLLVLASVAGVVGIVRLTDATRPVYAAASALTPGEHIAATDLVRRDVVLDGADRLYLAPDDVPASGLVVTRSVAKGELVPASSVGASGSAGLTSIVVSVEGRLSSAVTAGAEVDVWSAAAPQGEQAAAPPAVLVPGATVSRILDDDRGLVAGSERVGVEVLVPRTRVARVLEAVAAEQQLSIVPAGLPLGSTP